MRISDWSSDVCSSDLLARRDLAGELAKAADAGRHVVGQKRCERLAAAREGDVVDARGLDADLFGDQPDQDVVGTAGRTAGPGDGPRVSLELRDQVVERLDLRGRRHDNDLVLAGQTGDRGGLLRSEEHTSELQSLMRTPYA